MRRFASVGGRISQPRLARPARARHWKTSTPMGSLSHRRAHYLDRSGFVKESRCPRALAIKLLITRDLATCDGILHRPPHPRGPGCGHHSPDESAVRPVRPDIVRSPQAGEASTPETSPWTSPGRGQPPIDPLNRTYPRPRPTPCVIAAFRKSLRMTPAPMTGRNAAARRSGSVASTRQAEIAQDASTTPKRRANNISSDLSPSGCVRSSAGRA